MAIERGRFNWVEFVTIGWKSERVTPIGENLEYRVFSTGAPPTGGIMKSVEPRPTHGLYYFKVDDINEAASRVSEKGGKLHGKPQLVPTGDWVATVDDPLGGTFALISRS